MAQSVAQLILPIKMEKSSERLTSLGGLVVLEELARGWVLQIKADWEKWKLLQSARLCCAGLRGGKKRQLKPGGEVSSRTEKPRSEGSISP